MKSPIDHPELGLRKTAADAAAERLAADVQRLIGILRGRGWCTARQLGQIAHDLNLTERRLCVLAAASDGAIVSWPGSPGYQLFDETTKAELDHAARAMASQISEMQTRVTALLRRHHARKLITQIHNNPL